MMANDRPPENVDASIAVTEEHLKDLDTLIKKYSVEPTKLLEEHDAALARLSRLRFYKLYGAWI
jgi:DNA repair ATPase RecN